MRLNPDRANRDFVLASKKRKVRNGREFGAFPGYRR